MKGIFLSSTILFYQHYKFLMIETKLCVIMQCTTSDNIEIIEKFDFVFYRFVKSNNYRNRWHSIYLKLPKWTWYSHRILYIIRNSFTYYLRIFFIFVLVLCFYWFLNKCIFILNLTRLIGYKRAIKNLFIKQFWSATNILIILN